MVDFQPIDDAPRDGTWIEGRNEAGETATIQARPVHPKLPEPRLWFVGEPEKQGNWIASHCFYPVEWRPL